MSCPWKTLPQHFHDMHGETKMAAHKIWLCDEAYMQKNGFHPGSMPEHSLLRLKFVELKPITNAEFCVMNIPATKKYIVGAYRCKTLEDVFRNSADASGGDYTFLRKSLDVDAWVNLQQSIRFATVGDRPINFEEEEKIFGLAKNTWQQAEAWKVIYEDPGQRFAKSFEVMVGIVTPSDVPVGFAETHRGRTSAEYWRMPEITHIITSKT